MASKKVNPQLLQKLARIDAAQKAPKSPSAANFRRAEEASKAKKPKAPISPSTTVPPGEEIPDFDNMSDDEIADWISGTETPKFESSSAVFRMIEEAQKPFVEKVTIPKPKPAGKPGEKVSIGGMSVTLDEEGNIDNKRYPYAWAIWNKTTERETEAQLEAQGLLPKKGGFFNTIGNIVGKGLEYTVAKPLMAIDAPRRVIISGIKEGVDAINAGDASWSDFINQSKDVNFGFGDVVQTGNKWLDRTIGFIGDVGLDPTTYLTLGTGTAAKMTLKGASKYVGKELVEQTAQQIGTRKVKDLTKDVAQKIATDLGKESIDKEARILARAVLVESAQLAKAAGKAGADDALREATNRWAVAGPRRQLGAKTKEAMADGLRQLRDEALQEAKDLAGTAAGRRAEQFANALTNDVLVDIATRGYAALTEEVGRQLGIKGGFRLGVGRAKVAFGAPVTKGIGKVTAGARLKPLRGQGVLGDISRTIADKITPQGADGIFNSDDIFDWRTGLRQARFLDSADYKAGVRAIELLGEDVAYRAAKKSAVNSTKAVLKESLANKAYKPFYKTVYEVLATDEIFWDGVKQAADSLDDDLISQELENVARVLGRPFEEVEFAWRIKQGIDALYESTVGIAKRAGADISGVGTTARPSSWYPLTVTNRTARWLKSAGRGVVGTDGKIIPGTSPREVAKQLNLRGIKLGTAVPDQLKKGMIFFGKELSEADIRGGITRLNQIARDGGFQGEFFDTNIVSAIDRWANKWAGDYAFLKRYSDNLIGDAGVIYKSPLKEQARVAAGIPEGPYSFLKDMTTIGAKPKTSKFVPSGKMDEALESTFDDIESGLSNINDWTADDFDLLREKLAKTHAEAIKYSDRGQRLIINDAYKTLTDLIDQLMSIKSAESGLGGGGFLFDGRSAEELLRGIYKGDDEIAAFFALTNDMMQQMSDYVRLFAKNKNQVLDFADKMNAQTLRTMVDLTEDAYVTLNNQIVPSMNVRADIAQFYNNIARYKDPKAAKGALEFFKYYTNTFKTWATTSVGFHTRNMISNAWQMLASGGNPKNLVEGAKIYKEFNKFLDKIKNDIDYRKVVLAEIGVDDAELYWTGKFTPENLVDEFLQGTAFGTKLSPTQRYAIKASLLDSGAVSAGDLEDIFGVVPAGARKVGFTGAEISDQLGTGLAKKVPGRLGADKIPATLQKASEYAGILPAVSRQFGNNVEKLNRFMLTYDGIRQGYSAAESAARTSRFLVDYEDLSSADEFMKQVIPFWMWMSRNLPVQIQNMYANPGVYQKYNSFKRAIEDEDGTSPLLPDWMKESGAFKLPYGLGTVAGAIGGSLVGGSRFGVPGAIGGAVLGGTGGFGLDKTSRLYARPDLGFPGTGSPSPLVEGVSDISSLAQGLNPAIRALVETFTDRDFQYGTPIEGFGAKTQNIAEDVLTPVSWLGRIGNIGAAQSDLPGPQWLQEILGVSGDEVKFDGEIYKKESPEWEARVNALMSFLGIPGRLVGANDENQARRDYLRRLEDYLEWFRNQNK